MATIKDLSGQKFGRLLVIQRDVSRFPGVYYECKCDCGNIKIVLACNLRSGDSTSCGCFRKDFQRFKDLTGQKFGKLTVLNHDLELSLKNRIRWICKCDCGNIKSVLGRI